MRALERPLSEDNEYGITWYSQSFWEYGHMTIGSRNKSGWCRSFLYMTLVGRIWSRVDFFWLHMENIYYPASIYPFNHCRPSESALLWKSCFSPPSRVGRVVRRYYHHGHWNILEPYFLWGNVQCMIFPKNYWVMASIEILRPFSMEIYGNIIIPVGKISQSISHVEFR